MRCQKLSTKNSRNLPTKDNHFDAVDRRFDAVDKSLSTYSGKINELVCELREAGVVKTTTILK